MSGYVAACYLLVIATLVTYSGWVIARYRAIEKRPKRYDGSRS